MGENIEELNIQISASTQNAEKGIERVSQKVKRLTEDIKTYMKVSDSLEKLQAMYPKAVKNLIPNTIPKYGQVEEFAKQLQQFGGDMIRDWAESFSNDTLFKGMDISEFEQFKEEAVEIRAAFDQWKVSQESLGNRLKHFQKRLQEVTKSSEKFASMIKRMVLLRAVRAVLREISEALKEGIGNLYQYSKYYGTDFAGAMDKAATSILYLRNSIAAALAPVLQMIMPYFERLVDWVVEGVNWLNQFFAVISGASTWTKAVKVTKEYADTSKEVTEATEEEAKAMKTLISGFDELNILEDKAAKNKKNSAITGANPSPLSMFEEMSMDTASESAKKWGERIKSIIEGIKRVMDDLGITFEDVLKTAGLIGAALLGWKLASGFISSIKNLIAAWDVLRVPIGVTLAIAGFALEAKGAYSIGKDGLNKQNLLQTIAGALVGIAGLTIAFGVNGLIFGIAASVVIGIVSYALGKQANNADYRELFDELNETHERLQKKIDESLEFKANVKIHFEEVQTELGEIESKAEAAKRLVDDLFSLSEKDNKTAEEMRTIQAIADQLNQMGIEIHIDENGRVVETREQIEGLIEDMRTAARTEALMRGLTQAYQDQYEAQKRLRDAQEEVANASSKFYEVQELLWKSLSEEEKVALGVTKQTDLYGESLDGAYAVADKLDWETWNLIQALKEAGTNWEDSKTLADNYSEALEEVKQNVQHYEEELDIANGKVLVTSPDDSQLNETIEKVEKTLPEAITKANLLKVFPKATPEQIDSLMDKLTKDYPNAMDAANRKELSPKVDTSSVDNAIRKVETLQDRIIEANNSSLKVKNGVSVRTYSEYASGGFPDAGSLFVAREAGPELVGQIGRRTAVANNDQIVEGIAGGVRNANSDVVNALYAAASQIVRAVNDKDTNVVLDGQKVSEAVTKNQNRANRMYGVTLQNV